MVQPDAHIRTHTYKAIIAMSRGINQVSIERVQTELTKTLLSEHPEIVTEYQQTGLFLEILPELNSLLSSRDAQKVRPLLKNVPATKPMRYAALLSPLNSDTAKQILKKLRLDNATIDTAVNIIKYSKEEERISENEYSVREAMYRLGPRLLGQLFTYAEADINTKESVTGLPMRSRRIHLNTIKRYCDEIISGDDLMSMGLSGPEIGETLEWLLHIVLENPKLNEKRTLLAMLDTK